MKQQNLVPRRISEHAQPKFDYNIGGEEAGVGQNTGPRTLRFGFKPQLYGWLWMSYGATYVKWQWQWNWPNRDILRLAGDT